jgi:hypothetical protein
LSKSLTVPATVETHSGRKLFVGKPPTADADIGLEYIQLRIRSQVKNDKKFPPAIFL